MATKMITLAMAAENFSRHHWPFIWKVSIFRKLEKVITTECFGQPTAMRQQSATKKISTKNHANHTESHVKSTKNDDLWLRHSDLPTYFKLHTSCVQNLFKDGSNTILLTVDVAFFVFGITGIWNMLNQKL